MLAREEYAGLAVVTPSGADHEMQRGRPVRRPRAPLPRGLHPHHNRVLTDVFTGAATAATARAAPLQDFYRAMVARGMREELAWVTLARKLAALTLRLWKKRSALRSDAIDAASTLWAGRSRLARGRSLARDSHFPGDRCGGRLKQVVGPAQSAEALA